MSYCVNCGVELAEYIRKCPLCSTEVINPNNPYDFASEPPYPEYTHAPKQQLSPKVLLSLIAILFLLPITVCILADVSFDGTFGWSGYVIASLFAVYTVISSALIVHKESVLLDLIFDHMAVLLLLVYVDMQTNGMWFTSFALPLICTSAVSSMLMVILIKVLKKRLLTVISIGLYLSGFVCIITDLLIEYNFYNNVTVKWSLYPFISLVIIGSFLMFIDNNKFIKRRLEKKFFI